MRNKDAQKQSVIGAGEVSAHNFLSDLGKLQGDLELVVADQEDILTRPNILYSLGAAVLATCATAYYHGVTTVPQLALKAIYATVAQVIGVNVGLAIDNEHVDNITFAAGYYVMSNISGNLTQYNQKSGVEAVAGALAGYAANYYFSRPASKKPDSPVPAYSNENA